MFVEGKGKPNKAGRREGGTKQEGGRESAREESRFASLPSFSVCFSPGKATNCTGRLGLKTAYGLNEPGSLDWAGLGPPRRSK